MPRHSQMQHDPREFYKRDFVVGVGVVNTTIRIDDDFHSFTHDHFVGLGIA